jgi:[acyl-carrier-protein] S-malonyltransferase
MREAGPDLWLEIGPGKILSGLMRRIDRSQTVTAVADPEGLADFLEEYSDA